ncbi:MAG TPA: hypothetical protein ENH62_02515 [Marinobacter sp.]|uniref:Right handed beta helix domain-containing protein n=1 Tax=marine sediment metagenome TaxID=412755 RepID=A0A0F9FUM4_9ZZZZ|nr:hypothetical protein [Marinobacter sp.]
MALTEIYVDPAIAADSGAGTVGDPYGDLEYAIEQETFDLTNGTRVNTKDGTDEILVANIATAMADTSVSIAWVPGELFPLVFQGYTSTAGDGGIGGISGGGSVTVCTSIALDYVNFVDMHLHNCGSATVIDLDNFCAVLRCEVDNTTGGGVLLDGGSLIMSNYIHNVGTIGATAHQGSYIVHNFYENGINKFNMCIGGQNSALYIGRNICKIDSTSDGIEVGQDAYAENNSIWSDGGTGQGIFSIDARIASAIINNIVEGFSGAGGIGYDLDNATFGIKVYGGNASYDNATHFNAPGLYLIDDLGDNEILTESPFMDAANGDFRPRNVGNIYFGALPSGYHANAPTNIIQLHKGAVQPMPHPAPPRAWRF